MKTILRIAATYSVLALTSAGALAAPTQPAVGTLTIPTPFGSSPVVIWSWGAGYISSTGKASINDLFVTRYPDGQSPLFFHALAIGQHLATVVLVDGSTTITLTDAAVTGYSTGDSPNANTTRTENITFSFGRVTYTVNGVTTCFDVATNVAC